MVLDFKVLPRQGTERVRFGDPRDRVRKLLGDDFEEFIRTGEKIPADRYRNLGLFVYYKPGWKVEALEFGPPARVLMDGDNLLASSFESQLKRVRQMDEDIEERVEGYMSFRLGIGSYAPGHQDEPELPPEGIILFEDGYYD